MKKGEWKRLMAAGLTALMVFGGVPTGALVNPYVSTVYAVGDETGTEAQADAADNPVIRDSIKALTSGENKNLIAVSEKWVTYSFQPSESGTYEIHSVGNYDPVLAVYDGDSRLGMDDNGHKASNFFLQCELDAGKTYDFVIFLHADGGVEALEEINDLTVMIEKRTYDGTVTVTDGTMYLSGTFDPDLVRNYSDIDYIKTIMASEGTVLPTDCNSLFSGYWAATKFDLLNADTKNVINMRNMFQNCCSLSELNLSHFNTENVCDMYGMFSYCPALTELDVSSFDTTNVNSWMKCLRAVTIWEHLI